jgi:hypothetical protein
MTIRRPVTGPIPIVYPDDPAFERLVAEKKIASGADEAWTAFIHTRVPVRAKKKTEPGSGR